ncbi:1,4-dihydroxy-6-naphtoate synthase [Neolewinella maritima]|uniref:1,4-dihydroxy-6-naphtoate synthase n=1 Tax=Neolewinella maritima TaxID=1383882 RepID=A0ABN8F5Y2_9BACT|nr:1,4-dihydroxy-6-naphthoate synthase [Neolewinella maritima]CAH1000352.1 1,4-dihydroxy-6-naphtoate synthase [Neolewinella maritima]
MSIAPAPRRLSIGFSPCPNDTFIFDALVHQRIDTEGLTFDVTLADVEELNQRAFRGELEVTKLSYHALGFLLEQYNLLNAGSALGRGVGPLLVRAKTENFGGVNSGTTAVIPGKYTTANYLLGLAYPEVVHKTPLLFSEIEQAVLSGQYDTGLLIHENRFTYAARGLSKIIDLGEYWEQSTGMPIPLGGIAVRNDLPREVQERVDRVLARSVQYAFDHPEASRSYVRAHAQEMDAQVIQKHIALYVNDYTRSLGEEGRAAVAHFFADGREKGIIPAGRTDYIV